MIRWPDALIEAHDKGDIDLLSGSVPKIARHFGCSESSAYLARKNLRDREGWKPPPTHAEQVIAAHKANEINLLHEKGRDIAKRLGVHHSAITEAIQKLNLMRQAVGRRHSPSYYYWRRWKKDYGIFKAWGVLPERVGKSPNEWREYVRNLS